MIRGGFLDAEAKRDLIELARDGSVEHRLGRRANALLLLDNGMSCVDVAKVLFTHTVRPVGCWAPKDAKVAVEQNSGCDRLNIHGAIDLEIGSTRMIEALSVNAQSTIMLPVAITAVYPAKRLIHVISR